MSLLYLAWRALLAESPSVENEHLLQLGLNKSDVPNAPHLENCKLKAQVNERLDKRDGNENFPPWTSWKGLLETYPAAVTNERFVKFKHQAASEGAHPPWVCSGALHTIFFIKCRTIC